MEKEKKTIKCSYAVLVIILFATLAFVTGYSVVERKVNKCSCPDCSASGNTNVVNDDGVVTNNDDTFIEDNNVNNDGTSVTVEQKKIYTYNDLAGHYSATHINADDPDHPEEKLELYLYSDATFYYTYTSRFFAGSVGNYIIDDGKITLNTLLVHGSDIGTGVSFSTNTITFNDNYNIVINFLPSASKVKKDDIVFSKVESYNENNNENSLVKKRLNETELYNDYEKTHH